MVESVAPHVVALDDDADVRRVLTEYLGRQYLRITAVATGREMLTLLEREPVDLLLLDLRLPGEDGLALARRVRETSSVPILIISGQADEADRVMMGLELAADDYLTKPFSPRELLARIRAVLRAEVPIILITGRREAETDRQAQQAGVAEILEKPLRATKLQEALGRVLGTA
jgi:DNA-binding response OmpR family regulator